nr:hypothetical protein [Tanacetum cinerariifolium]
MAAPDLNGTHTRPCLSNPNPAKPKSDNNVKIEISTELIMKLRNNAYNGAEANNGVDHITRFLQIINLVKTPDLSSATKNALWNFWENGYDNDILIDDEESSDDESNESDQNPFFDPYQNNNEKGDKSHHKECEDNTNQPENFDTTHSDVKERLDNGMCIKDRFEVFKYSIGDDEEFMGIRTLERHSWAQTIDGISSIYLDIFRKKDEGWTVHRIK